MKDAFRAEYSGAKFIMTRKVLQIQLELPMEHAAQAFDLLGYPDPNKSQWVAVALLREEVE